MKALKNILALTMMVIGFFTMGCSKDSGSNNTNNPYYMNGAYCYNTQGQQVATNLCNNMGQYYMNGAYCYNQQGQQVDMQLCNSNGWGQQYGQQCVGYYWWDSNMGRQQVYCSGADCAGWTLTSVQTGQQVFCQ